MAAFIGLQQDSLEFRSNASISAYPGQKKESVWTQKASACHIIYCAWQGREVKAALDLRHCLWVTNRFAELSQKYTSCSKHLRKKMNASLQVITMSHMYLLQFCKLSKYIVTMNFIIIVL